MKRKHLVLFLSALKLSASTFGGGFVIISLMRKTFVEQLGWITEQEMLDMTALAQSSPGAIAVNASILVGYHVAGMTGAAVTIAGTILPPLVIISVISLFYQWFRDLAIVSLAMKGMLCGVAAVILEMALRMSEGIWKQRRMLPLFILASSFLAVQIFHPDIVWILLVCGFAGACDTLLKENKRRKGAV